ncbi:DNA excision repair protein ERCC-2 [Tamilnaduibacter salinus]|uniref:DNA excision repair protein ERCC-2 n=1 Tax=Tamilnaduibacter salinus TaxID=1484056 RepID=A0A2U1CX61_9GAMM|nr:ATP-dependent DNA helicase [Tamilnaduibacter salinus]PVY76831.1 DNA excision repair protein ERCC-2 [Tamilnaduibacter salinus]
MKVSVRTLCEFAARHGDLDHRYTPAPSADEGIAGHQRIQARRGPRYVPERRLSGECGGLQLSGRADGYDPLAHRLEEIKTHRGDHDRIPRVQRELHRAQLRAYGALLCAETGFDSVTLTLVYYDTARDQETPLTESADAATLWQELTDLCDAYRAWAQREASHRQARDEAMAALSFPFGAFRRGQRPLAETVYRNSRQHRTLMLQAPTGLGKTLGTLFPALMALPKAGQDRVFYLTSRNSGRGLALDALARLAGDGETRRPLRVLELSAKPDACEHPDKACHGDSCPLARGFFDRLPAARQEAAGHPRNLDRAALASIAARHTLCPYFLSQEMARWSDVVVADVNRFFDQHALLHALTQQNDWRVSLLIDEAHNLIDRARGMYSVTLSQPHLLSVRRQAPAALKRPLNRVARQWQALVRDEAAADGPRFLDGIPTALVPALNALVAAITDYLADYPPDLALQELLFECLSFTRLADAFDDHSLCELQAPRRGQARLTIQNLIPADFLAPRFQSADSTLLFSATLTPGVYHRDLLGLPETTSWQGIESPFTADQLALNTATHISTRRAHRDASLAPIADLIARQFREQPGNYLAYFSSFAYLDAVLDVLKERAPDIPTWHQRPGMDRASRDDFMAGFRPEGVGVAFAVLGGVFGEGIDLPGDRLIGAFVATLGLPPFNEWHQVLKDRLEARFGAGDDYTYLYPGIQKVAQAAGRVIRTPEDRGVIWLIDDRFGQPRIRRLLPGWWFGAGQQNPC